MTPDKTYNQHLDDLRIPYEATSDPTQHYAQTYMMLSANLHTFMPHLPSTEYLPFLRDVLYYQRIAGIDEKLVEKADDVTVTGLADSLWDAVAGKPTILCTCHLGSYRVLNTFLARIGAKISLLIDNQAYQQQGEKFIRIYDEIAAHYNQPQGNLTLINAEQPSAGMQLMRALKQGRILVAYLDGNTGAGGVTRQDNKLVSIDFLNRPLLARKGLAFLSIATQTPIVPVFSFRPDRYSNTLHVMEPRVPVPVAHDEREAAYANLTQLLYNDFATLLRQYPSQWEGWLYVHKYLDLPKLRAQYVAPPVHEITAKSDWQFNHDRYTNLAKGDTAILFDKHLYRSIRVTGQLGELLRNPSVRFDAGTIKSDLINMLFEQAILC